MHQQKRFGIGATPGFVDEVNAASADIHFELCEPVELALVRPPVIARAPVIDQFPEVGEMGSVLPARIRDFAGQAGARQPLLEVGEHLVGDCDTVLAKVSARHRLDLHAAPPFTRGSHA
jgi:hypothetical protein